MEGGLEQDGPPAKRPRLGLDSYSSSSDDPYYEASCPSCWGDCSDSSDGCEQERGNELIRAVSNLNLDLVRTLISKGVSVNEVHLWRGETPLTTACRLRPASAKKLLHANIINLLIENGASVNLENSKKQTPLHVACTTEAVKLLLQNGASVYAQNKQFETPLLTACRYKRPLDLISALVDAGALNAKNGVFNRGSPLHIASPSVMELLLQKGADPNGMGENEPPLFTFCRKSPGPLGVITTLLENGASIQYKDRSGRTALHVACSAGVKETVQLLIEKGASVNEADKSGETPLFLAAKKQAVTDDIINLLLMNGASINVKSRTDRTPLHASRYSAKILLQHGAKVDEPDIYGETPLLLACRGLSWRENAPILLQYGASVNLKNKVGNKPLYVACANFFKDVVQLLLRNGASVNESNGEGESPIFAVVRKTTEDYHGAGDLIAELLQHGALIDMKNSNGETPLHVACKLHKQATAAMKSLLQHGASVRETTHTGETPLEYSCGDSSQILLDYGASHCMLTPPSCLGKGCRFFRQHFVISRHIVKKVEASVHTVQYDPASGFGPELAKMKSSTIGTSTVSFFDLLHMNVPRFYYEEVLSSVTPRFLENCFPKFCHMIYCSYLKIKKIRLMDECCSFFSLTPLPVLPPELAYKVFDSLSVPDLVILLHIIRTNPLVYEQL